LPNKFSGINTQRAKYINRISHKLESRTKNQELEIQNSYSVD